MMKRLSVGVVTQKFGTYNYYHETGTTPELILFWVRDTIAVFKKQTQLLIESGDIDIYDINTIDIDVGGDHGQEASRFPIKILYIMIMTIDVKVCSLWSIYYARRIME